MSLLRQVLAEIYSMFAGDAVMSACTLAIVAIAVALHAFTSTPSGLIGFALFGGCVVVMVVRVTTYVKQTRL
jgi:hypothetical protein